jgi:hypothetical protein
MTLIGRRGDFSVSKGNAHMPSKGPNIDTDNAGWTNPKREKGADDRVPQSRDISKMIEKEQKRTANPSR